MKVLDWRGVSAVFGLEGARALGFAFLVLSTAASANDAFPLRAVISLATSNQPVFIHDQTLNAGSGFSFDVPDKVALRFTCTVSAVRKGYSKVECAVESIEAKRWRETIRVEVLIGKCADAELRPAGR